MNTAFLRITAFFLMVVSAGSLGYSQTATETKQPEASMVSRSAPFPTSLTGEDKYRIGFQDTLDIQIFRHPELNQRVAVNNNGTINLYRIPEAIVAVCKTERELSNDVAEAYRKDYLRNPEVTVVAAEQRSRAFAVIGAVEKPGSFLIGRKITLLELLAQAGGPTKEAGSRLIVARTGSTSNCKMNESDSSADEVSLMNFRIKDILEAKRELVMRPGDIVSVLDADVLYVYGNVNKQGQIVIKEPLTLTQALASAEGLKPATKRGKIRVLRQRPDSLEREELVYNLDDIDKRKAQDPYLEPNDVVAVSEDAMKSIMRAVGKSLTGGLPSILYRVPL